MKHRVIGIGGKRTHIEGYIRSFAADPRCEVVAIADEPDLPRYRDDLNRELAAELDLPYLPLADALLMEGVDIACACPDVERRARVLEYCLDAGLHVYMDKPLAGSAKDAGRIASAATRAGTVTQVFSLAHAPWAREAAEALRAGRTGRLLAVHSDMLMAKGHLGDLPEGTVRCERGSDGRFTFIEAKREMFDMGVYPVSLICTLTGKRVRTVHATTGNYFFTEHAKLDVEDFGALLMTLEDGTVATAMAGRVGVHSHPAGGVQQVTLIGDSGSLRFSDDVPRIEVYTDTSGAPPPARHEFDPMMMWASTRLDTRQAPKDSWLSLAPTDPAMDVRAFIDCVENGERPLITAADAAHHVEVLMAAYESARTGSTVELTHHREN